MPNLVHRLGKVDKQGNAFQRGFVGGFIRESDAPGVPSNTTVSGAGPTTQFPNVSNLIPNHHQGIQGLSQLVPIMPLPTAVLPTEALPTLVKAKSLEVYLTGYQEASRKHLLAGFLHGFRLHFQGPQEGSCSNDLVSASEHADIVDQKLAKEIQAGRIIGPFEKPHYIISKCLLWELFPKTCKVNTE